MKTDIELQRDVVSELSWEPSVNAAHIAVSVKAGVVTLRGHASTYAEKQAAEEAARRVYGVRAVVNELDVKLPDRRTDEDVAAAAVRALEWNILVPADKIKVTVSNGWLKLEGEVSWRFQKNAAERAVRKLPGVRGVSNLITVGPSVTPTEVKARIEEALRRSALLDARRIRIEVVDGEVTLHGGVRSWAEREEVERVAWAAPGVHDVENLITVEA
ncbi:BON domain-containing protein [Sorangium sp. So ce693]|uniref:BON domain-containing protein n=1 Tax=Sorangium sp. So ce693 TaxID=3133318 RepID=UPI003F625665